eukprot:SAG31_NODE_2896_length_4936_cov_5.275377_3_plen_218_part_00
MLALMSLALHLLTVAANQTVPPPKSTAGESSAAPPPADAGALCALRNASGPRRSCGYLNQPEQCVANGCCWDPLVPNPGAEPWCFHPAASKLPVRLPVEKVRTPFYADDQAALCWLNASVATCPNPLAGLPRLPKPHYSWPFSLVTPNFSRSPVIQDCECSPHGLESVSMPRPFNYLKFGLRTDARITHSVPIDLCVYAALSLAGDRSFCISTTRPG